MSPKISILIPIYGVEAYIEQCARSVFGQTYPNIEIIFINDGTPDRSMEILRSLIKNEYNYLKDKIKIVEQVNKGLPIARITGLAEATGDYIFFVDSDDWIEPDSAECIASCAARTNADMIHFGLYKEKGNRSVARIERDWSKKGKMEYIKALYTRKTYGYLCLKCFKRSIYTSQPLFIPVKGMLEDICFAAQLIYRTESICRLHKYLYHYRRTNPHALTRQKRSKKRLDSSINLMSMYRHYKDNLNDCPIQEAYRYILYYTAWNAIYYKLPLFEMFQELADDVRHLSISGKNLFPLFKQIAARLYLGLKD